MDSRESMLEQMLSRVGDLGFRRRIVRLMECLDIKETDTVLDCGCGEGFYSMIISELYGPDLTAFDFNAELLEKAADWIEGKKRVKFLNGDLTKGLPFEANSFDKIVFTEVLEHLDEDAPTMKEIFRVLKPGGIVGLTVPNASYPLFWDPPNWIRGHLGLGHFNPKNTVTGGVWSYDHKRLYRHGEIKRLAEETGFNVMEMESVTHYCVPFNYLILRLGKLFYTSIPASLSTAETMEKFEWRKEAPKSRFDLIMTVFKLFKWVDSGNDRLRGVDKSSVSVLLKLEKPTS
ncbi:MAG: class I SAM-dependent methyltransferase [Proteobacteria bacterium]|nr:class I SAM-dependent methyltransferase [Pseudomonadota bacterium]